MYKIVLICFLFLGYHVQGHENSVMVMETNYGIIELQLFPDEAPLACENFIRLAEEGLYNGCPFHRIIPQFMIQGGDYVNQNGSDSRSIWGEPFQDEFSEKLRFNAPGMLAMANVGSHTNGSQFFITTAKTLWLNDRHTLFGKVVSGFDAVAAIEALGSPSGNPRTSEGSWFSPIPIDPPVILSLTLKNLQEIVTQKE